MSDYFLFSRTEPTEELKLYHPNKFGYLLIKIVFLFVVSLFNFQRTSLPVRHLKPSEHLWWAQMDSNHRPHAYQACALTTWAMRPYLVLSFRPFPCGWWRLRESNPWPPACKAGALPAELNPRILLSKCSFEYLQNWTTFANYKLLFKTRD